MADKGRGSEVAMCRMPYLDPHMTSVQN